MLLSELDYKLLQNQKDAEPLIAGCLIKDRYALSRAHSRLLKEYRTINDNAGHVADIEKLAARISASRDIVEQRKALIPEIEYDDKLPVASKRQELLELIKNNQVVVIAGETGSGKTTQIPKICLEAGLGVHGKIGCTKPSRLAARSVSERIED